MNKGNGPILGPQLTLGANPVRLVSEDPRSGAYLQPGAFAVGEIAYALFDSPQAPTDKLVIRGVTLSGADFAVYVDCSRFDAAMSLVAEPVL